MNLSITYIEAVYHFPETAMRSSEFAGSLEACQLLNNDNVDLINEKIAGFYIVLPFPIEDKTEPLTYIDAGVGNIRTGLRQMATKYGPNFYFTYHEE